MRSVWRRRRRDANTVNILRIVWLIAVFWFEVGTFHWSVIGCNWPDKGLAHSQERPAHVLLIADPQVIDSHSYPDRSRFYSWLTQLIVDLNLRKNWSVAKRYRPDAVVFLGDMMDNGRSAKTDQEYREYYDRFKSIFSTDPSLPVYYIPGNHDIGLGNSRTFSPESKKRYIKTFGPMNRKVSVAKHTFLLIDAPGLVEEDYLRASSGQRFEDWTPRTGGPIDFVRKFVNESNDEPVILFSHIPLFRPDTAKCGPLREKGSIRRGVGLGYQNTLGKQTTEYLLRTTRPVLIFSGDDHDYCLYTHRQLLTEGPEPQFTFIREVTIKSFSMAMGISHPGFHLLSLVPPPPTSNGGKRVRTNADAPCFLPDQLSIYTARYIPLLVLSALVLAFSTYRKLHRLQLREFLDDLPIPILNSRTPDRRPPHRSRSDSASTSTFASANMTSPGVRPDSAVWAAFSPNIDRSQQLQQQNYNPSNLGASTANTTNGRTRRSPGPSHTMPVADDDDDEDHHIMHGSASQYARQSLLGNEKSIDAQSFRLSPPAPGRARHAARRRRWAWSWTFVVGDRRRRFTVGVPPLIEEAIVNTFGLGSSSSSLGHENSNSKGGGAFARHFFSDFLAAAWPPILLFTIISFVFFR